jgi:XTP/dITP diphosphohydrolase
MIRRRLVIASANPGKLREFRDLLEPLGWDVVSQSEFGVAPAEEPHATFLENALAKARHAAAATGLPALADDSGLCVAALAGAPGVLSARFAGEPADEARNNRELLRRLAAVTDRRAHYTCVLAALRAADDPEPLVADGRWAGEILSEPRGRRGFGYDPLFLVPALGRTAAELEPADKNRLSHRGQAMADLARKMAASWD